MVKRLFLNSEFLWIIILMRTFKCSFKSSEINKIAEPIHNLRIYISISYTRLLRSPRRNRCADKVYIKGFVRGIHEIFLSMFKDMSLKFGNIQTQKSAPIRCTVWPRNVWCKLLKNLLRNKKIIVISQSVFSSKITLTVVRNESRQNLTKNSITCIGTIVVLLKSLV